MKVVYFGSDVYLPCFRYFLKNHEILALYTYHNDEDYFSEYGIVKEAEKNNIPVFYGQVTDAQTKRYFEEEGCELFFVAEYSHIIHIPEDVPAFRGINVHGSLLPKGRSYYPIEAAMQRGERTVGFTVHKLAPTIDSGNIMYNCSFPLTDDIDSVDVYLNFSESLVKKLPEIIENFDEYWNKATPQGMKLPYWKRPEDIELMIDSSMTVEQALSVFRKYNKMTEVCVDGERYYIRMMNGGTAVLGEMVWVDDDLVLYPATDGHLRLLLKKIGG